MSLLGKAVVLMGKNTMVRKAIRGHLENNPPLEKLLPHIRDNVGFVFTKEDLTEIRDMLLANKKRGLALSVETEYTFTLAEKVKALLADPSVFVAAAPVAAATTVAPAAVAPTKAEAKEELEESDEDMGFGLFD
ncbi:60S acidic ribosomal protein P0 [Microtus ochrogaster]|uniref:Large ribosomal subunit protein uL10 n=1 Tax=Microtus ochrogaster TaxID=79684 RepID=A0A8J6GTJ0_MICOH|nr:60S acidic ribosomal protein P0 [Microtus ochrogaster]